MSLFPVATLPVATLSGKLISPTLNEFKFSSLVNTVVPSQVMLEALRFKVNSSASILPENAILPSPPVCKPKVFVLPVSKSFVNSISALLI